MLRQLGRMKVFHDFGRDMPFGKGTEGISNIDLLLHNVANYKGILHTTKL